MTGEANNACLICGTSVKPLIDIPDVPVLCSRLCASVAEAATAPHGDNCLTYCFHRGHVVNCAFDPARVTYDSTLSYSPRYRQYANAAASRVICRYGLTGKRIVEIGCGGGDFLDLLCSAENSGEGYDPSQPTGRDAAGAGSFEIIGRNFAVEDASGIDFVCCRHVLEHLPKPLDLLRRFHKGLFAGGGAVVLLALNTLLRTRQDLVIIMHPEYQSEIRSILANRGIQCEVVNA